MAHITQEDFALAAEDLVFHAMHKINKAADQENDRLDEQIKKLDNMGRDELEELRERRLMAMKQKQEALLKLKAQGHGQYREIPDTKEFFAEVKASKMCVVHFYRDATERCKIVDKHMLLLAPKHMETKFVKVNAEKNPFLCERLRIVMLPTIVLLIDGKTDHSIIGFDEMGGHDDFPTIHLEWLLAKWKVIHYDGEVGEEPPELAMPKKAAAASLRSGFEYADDDFDFDD